MLNTIGDQSVNPVMLNKTHQAAWYRVLPKSAIVVVIISVVNLVIMLIRGYMAELSLRDSGFTIIALEPISRGVFLVGHRRHFSPQHQVLDLADLNSDKRMGAIRLEL